MSRRFLCVAGLLLILLSSTFGVDAGEGTVKKLRVCADPNNLPFSNKEQEGFENKIAELMAKELGATLTYYWWPHQRGMVRRTLSAGLCDVLIGIPMGYKRVLWTKPYYRTGYVIAYLNTRGFQIKSLDDPLLKTLRVGVHRGTPPEEGLAKRGILGDNVIKYSLFYDWDHPVEFLAKPMKDVIAGEIDVAVLWGPVVGYCVKKYAGCPLETVILPEDDPRNPVTFEISMGVKKGNKALKAQLEEVLSKRQVEIRQILEEYGVPLLAVQAPRGA